MFVCCIYELFLLSCPGTSAGRALAWSAVSWGVRISPRTAIGKRELSRVSLCGWVCLGLETWLWTDMYIGGPTQRRAIWEVPSSTRT
jgi:hypothetical protein